MSALRLDGERRCAQQENVHAQDQESSPPALGAGVRAVGDCPCLFRSDWRGATIPVRDRVPREIWPWLDAASCSAAPEW